MTRLGNPTGPKPRFSRADVVEAALTLGIADFTLTAVAGRLGVAVSGLYRTISSREDLLAACLERVATQMDLTHPGTTWQDAIRAHAESMWNLLEQYPGLAGVVVSVPWAHQLFAGPFAQAHQSLVERGLDPEEAGVVLDFVGDTVITMHAQIEVHALPHRSGRTITRGSGREGPGRRRAPGESGKAPDGAGGGESFRLHSHPHHARGPDPR